MSDLTEFLLARLAEVEEVARSVPEVEAKSTTAIFTSLSEPTGTVEMSPARVLAEVEAKRRIVEVAMPGETDDPHAERGRILRLLASVYAGHPDFREEWAT